MAKFEVFYNKNKKVINANNLWDAKQKAIKCFKVSKKNENLIAIQSFRSKENQDFRYL
jgi:hypothetical protein